MIGKLKGIVDSTDEDHAVIDVHGVGYTVFCSSRTLGNLALGEAATLFIETHVREDHIHLYGFLSAGEREWFRLLTSVQRVGAKMALSILGALTTEQISHAILAKDTTAFSRISGIGPKLAERIVAELKDKVVDSGSRIADRKKSTTSHEPRTANHALEDTVSALLHLGYGRSEAYAAALNAAREIGEEAKVGALIKQSLKELAG
jgi:Holliday junction DNA helicase RuvA